ncbi:TPA: polysaccharide biosynthesis tyrosine autokinase [Staphylococcus pseudintermedius]|uniref:polysaccharide biosynthesis tyrosine autokinase n=1 Tax=Staphylococcus pseudintermedius TaxID=283734 RepID=UPI0007AE3FDC|nr:polysaccharide biosynthesis tyrosine autokinase [Staphylococcus pseudintermedius]EGQ0374043.1 polysaccharide biosynthesis tyrosine autokinase [Staphylococcus pseudintermedius]EGQ1625765.1 polysaccharide biosynthesis tyrosine autokinase [Staphylococcus pseudintermedius]EGQ1662123.1 polysaccharide biosynthesis tyrosine autokinase [Staphylococcus pseudintermedius]EGQ2816762.1 polysaccharide biosynthesis tyrosine autokinase [Staphylococcus pseudintermedius]EGQ2887934.1 polysaccharide biosynthes
MQSSRKKTAEEQLIVHHKPKSPVSEKFRSIRSNIMFAGVDEPIKSVIITSSLPLSGKSTISANLAVTYAQANYRTLIIDGDMRKPTQHYIFNLQNNKGLSSVLMDWNNYEQMIQQTEVEGLDVLTSGPTPPNPSELITSQAFQKMYQHLLDQYDFIIIDTPPINSVTDAQLYAEISGHAIYVINVEKNNRNQVIKGQKELEKSNSKILGVVLNKIKPDKDSGYYAYYGDE